MFSYPFGLSLRRASELVSHFEPASHEAVRKWYWRLDKHVPSVKRRRRAIVAIDEARLKGIHVRHPLPGKNRLETTAFIEKTVGLSAGIPRSLTDRSPWYEKAFRRL